MKKIFLFLCGWIHVLLCFVACGGDDASINEEPMIEVTSVRLSQTKLILTVGESHSLTAKVLPENATDKNVTWKSSDASIATVSSSGVVKAIGAGTATITATAGGKSATCQVTVEENVVEVTAVTLSSTELSLTVGESHSLTAKVLPENATDKSVTWKSSDASIATVSSSGAVKAIGAGTATITATAGGKSATCQVTVKQKGGGVDASIGPWGENDIYEGTVN
ncbi:MAG: Ig domain-containing protein [Bacteroidaceae bacterium]|nr:Ig domain-containing protein [Bacteroidaceae bacterium]